MGNEVQKAKEGETIIIYNGNISAETSRSYPGLPDVLIEYADKNGKIEYVNGFISLRKFNTGKEDLNQLMLSGAKYKIIKSKSGKELELEPVEKVTMANCWDNLYHAAVFTLERMNQAEENGISEETDDEYKKCKQVLDAVYIGISNFTDKVVTEKLEIKNLLNNKVKLLENWIYVPNIETEIYGNQLTGYNMFITRCMNEQSVHMKEVDTGANASHEQGDYKH